MRLEAGGKIGSLAHYGLLLRGTFADQIADHNKPRCNPYTDLEWVRSPGFQSAYDPNDVQPGPNGSLGIVLVGSWDTRSRRGCRRP